MPKTITAKPSAVRGTITAGRTCEAIEVIADLPGDTLLVDTRSNTSRTVEAVRSDPLWSEFATAVCAMDPAAVVSEDDAASIISIAEQSRSMSPAAVLAWGGTLGLAVTAGIFIAAQRAR